MRTFNYFLIAIFALLYSCDTNKSQTPEVYNFLLSQPDGTIPDDGFAVICESQIDPVTGYLTVSVPVTDTIYWHGDLFSWVDDRDDKTYPLQIKMYSPDEYTSFSERFISENINNYNNELLFPQLRPIEVIIRVDDSHPITADAWAIIVTPHMETIEEINGASSVMTSQFNDFKLSESSTVILKTEALFTNQMPLYCHLFRYNGTIWQEVNAFEADIASNNGKIKFHTQHFLSCYE